MTTTTQIPNSQKQLVNTSITLDIGKTSGSFEISIPFVAEYMLVMNDSGATLSVNIGNVFQSSNDAQLFTPGKYISLPLIQPTQKLTVFWNSDAVLSDVDNLVQFYFSNVTIPLSGGDYGGASTSQDVTVMNTVTTQFAATPSVNVQSLPENPLEVAINGALPSGTNNIGLVDVNTLPSLPQGTNNIGQVDINTLPTVQTESTTAEVLTVPSAAIISTTTSADLDVSKLTELALDVNLTAFAESDNTYQLTVNRKGLDGVYYPIYTGSTITNTIQPVSISLGHPNNQSLGNMIQIVETIGGTTPSITRSMSVIGK